MPNNTQKPSVSLQSKRHATHEGAVDGYSAKYRGRKRKRREGLCFTISPPCLVARHKHIAFLSDLYDEKPMPAPRHGHNCGNGLRLADELRSMGYQIDGSYSEHDGQKQYAYSLTPKGRKQAKVALEYLLWLSANGDKGVES